MVSKIVWDKLTAEQQKIILEAAEETKVWQRAKQDEINNKLKADIQKTGKNVIIELTPEQKNEFRQKLAPLYKKYAPQMNGIVEKIYKELGRTIDY